MAPAPQIQAVTFDAGGTLLETWPSVGHLYAEAAAQFGIRHADPATLTRRFAAAWEARDGFDYSRQAWARLVAQTFSGLCDGAVGDALFAGLYERFAHREAWRLFPDVLPALEGLRRRGVKMAVISNWDDRLLGLLRELGLADFFSDVCVSFKVGIPKPSSHIFALASQRLGVPAGAILHVGDSPVEDGAGARAAGFQAALLRRQAGPRNGEEIGSLAEVLARVNGASAEKHVN
ncbi:MAG: HAD-IA family hydrolase [Verrucomicrobia bacterium]|nr:HAD-IA family hydrolase [Verrucomicrobiota bacterium]